VETGLRIVQSQRVRRLHLEPADAALLHGIQLALQFVLVTDGPYHHQRTIMRASSGGFAKEARRSATVAGRQQAHRGEEAKDTTPVHVKTHTYHAIRLTRRPRPAIIELMPRYCYRLRIKPDCIEEYEREHTRVWPELLAKLRKLVFRLFHLPPRQDLMLVFRLDDFDKARTRWAATP